MKITVDEGPNPPLYIYAREYIPDDHGRCMEIEDASVIADVDHDGNLLGVEFVNGDRLLSFIQEHGGEFDFDGWVKDHWKEKQR